MTKDYFRVFQLGRHYDRQCQCDRCKRFHNVEVPGLKVFARQRARTKLKAQTRKLIQESYD